MLIWDSLMIKSFRHKGLKRFYATGSTSGIQPDHAGKLRMQLAALDTATSVEDMDIPGFRLPPLKGEDKGRWSIRVNGNWRVTFTFQDGNAYKPRADREDASPGPRRLLGRTDAASAAANLEAEMDALIQNAIRTSEIEGEHLNVGPRQGQ